MQALSASIALPVSSGTAFRVIADLNTLLRLSPFFSLNKFSAATVGPPQPGDQYAVTIEYYEEELIETHCIEVDEFEMNRRVSYKIAEGAIKTILFEIEPHENGIQFTQTLLLASEDETVVSGLRNKLQFWIKSVGEYVKLAEGTSPWIRAVKWFMDSIWLKLTLSERTIAIIMAKISFIEIVLLLIVVVLWNFAMR